MSDLITNTALIAKVRKLLALAQDGGASEAEAALAAEHVQRILQDNNLTMSQVEASGGSSDQATPRVKQTGQHRAMYAYQKAIMTSLAENNFCLHRVVQERDEFGRKSMRHMLIGRQLNVEVTTMTYEYLITTMKRLVLEAGYQYGKAGERDLHYWLDGCASRLVERLDEKRRLREAESKAAAQPTTGNGTHRELVLSDVYGSEEDLNNDELNGFAPGTTASTRRSDEVRRATQQAEHDRLVAEGVDSTVAWYRAYGWGEQEANQAAVRLSNRRRRGGRGRTQNWTQADERRAQKINSTAYRAGRGAANSIGLDTQVGAAKTRRITKGD